MVLLSYATALPDVKMRQHPSHVVVVKLIAIQRDKNNSETLWKIMFPTELFKST